MIAKVSITVPAFKLKPTSAFPVVRVSMPWITMRNGRLRLFLFLTAVVFVGIITSCVMTYSSLPLTFVSHSRKFKAFRELSRNKVLVYAKDVSGVRHDDDDVTLHLKCLDREGEGQIEDTLCLPRPDYLPNYKNPCFVDWSEPLPKVRCLPYFHVLGVDKSGTTDLHSRIAKHPDVLPNSGCLGKETYFWSWMKYGQFMRSVTKVESLSFYLTMFESASATIANNVDANGNHRLITGDGTPMDFWDFRGWPLIPQNAGLKEPVVLTPHLMRHLYRDPKFIVIFRNPVDRLYSDYFFLRYGFTPEKFRVDVPQAIAFMENCLKVNTTRQCVFSNHTYVHLNMRLHIGMYSVFMAEWLAVFPRYSFYILRTEDYRDNMSHHLEGIYRFLGLDPLPDQAMQKILDASYKYETQAKKRVAGMYPDTRKLLTDFYAPYLEKLAAMLGDPRFLW